MSVSEDSAPIGSDSFWDIGQYKRTVKRVDDGLKLCGQLMQLVRERGEIEANYAKELRKWSEKWNDKINKGPEYGTLRSGWQAPLLEAAGVAQLHEEMQQRLESEVHNTIKIFSKTAYKKTVMGTIKDSKDLEDSFRKVQKPWAKLYIRSEKCKREYHAACRSERTAINNDKNLQSDASTSVEQQKKAAEKVDKCKDEKEKAKTDYETTLREVNQATPKYLEDMTMVFERCQEAEEKRIKLFKEQLMALQSCLDRTRMQKFAQIYNEFSQTLSLVDPSQDLKWWEQHHGPAMSMKWPEFEEYSPELRPINKKQQQSAISDPVLIRNTATDSRSPVTTHIRNGYHANGDSNSRVVEASDKNRYDVDQVDDARGMSASGDEWALDDEDFTGVKGVQMRVIHAHQPSDDDELSLHIGDVIEHLKDKDDLGWCTGRKNGRVGLYPAGYVEPM